MIRKLTKKDVPLWKAIRLEALKEHPDEYIATHKEESAFSDEQWAHTLEQNTIFGFFEGADLVGVAGYVHMKPAKLRHCGKIFVPYVKATYRGKGVIDQLLDAITEHAQSHQIELMIVGVAKPNVRAIRCYKRHGYKLYGELAHSLKIGDVYVDEVMMVKTIK